MIVSLPMEAARQVLPPAPNSMYRREHAKKLLNKSSSASLM